MQYRTSETLNLRIISRKVGNNPVAKQINYNNIVWLNRKKKTNKQTFELVHQPFGSSFNARR